MPTPSRASASGGAPPRRPLRTAAAVAAALCVLLLAASARRRSCRRLGAAAAQPARRALKRGKGDLVAFVGVFTSAAPSADAEARYDYAARRAAARAAWFPPDAAALKRLETRSNIRARFVVGRPPNAAAAAALAAEERAHGPFLRLGTPERYDALPLKSAAFMQAAAASGARYVVKVDDDVFVRVDRLPHAVSQWAGLAGGRGADFVGCAKNGQVFADPAVRWAEPAAPLLGPSYFTNFWGPAYVLSHDAAALVADFAATGRRLANEDTTLALWLLAHGGVRWYDDRRLCSPACDAAAVAVYDYPDCAGLCDPVPRLADLAQSCVGGGDAPPLVPELIQLDGL